MADTYYKWTFPICPEQTSDVGFNEPMTENFRQFPSTSLVRESIQNSLDVCVDKSKPVLMSFKIKGLDYKNFFNFFNIRDHIKACLEYYNNFEKAHKTYEPMIAYLNSIIDDGKKMYYIEVSDYNTTGMTYVKNNNENAFYAFVRAGGVNLKANDASGGSFGFGKAAYFNFSKIRTLLVSTRDQHGNSFFEGVASLCTHRLDENKISNIGYYDNNNGYPVTNEEEIPERFRRIIDEVPQCGTDINIMGIDVMEEGEVGDNIQGKTIEEYYHKMTMAVLRNFWLAIYENRLEVNVGDLTISKDNLSSVMEEHFPEYDDNRHTLNYNPRGYFEAVRDADSDKKHKTYIWNINEHHSDNPIFSNYANKDFGTIKFYIFAHPNGNNKVLFMRQPRMLIERKTNNTANKYFGVFVCEDGFSNELLRLMENPAHNEWDAKHYDAKNNTNKKLMRMLLDEYRNFVTECIKDFFHINEKEVVDIEGLEQYLSIPSEIDEEENENEALNGDETGEIQDKGNSMTTDSSNEQVKNPISQQNMGAISIHKKTRAVPDNNGDLGSGKSDHPRNKPGEGMGLLDNEKNKYDVKGKEGIYHQPLKNTFRSFCQIVEKRVHHKLIIHSDKEHDNCQIKIEVGSDNAKEIINIIKSDKGTPIKNILTNVKLLKGRNVIDIVFSDNLQHSINLVAYEDR